MNYIEFKLIRESLHLSRHDLADMWGVSPRSVQRWDRGELSIPQNRIDQLNQLYDDVMTAVHHFESLLHQLDGKHNKADEILLLSYDTWTYDGDFPNYKVHNSCLIRCKQVAIENGYNVRIVPFKAQEYEDWLGDREDTKQTRSEWASAYYSIFKNRVSDIDTDYR